MRIGHASISENGNNGRDGKAKAGDQTGKEVCTRNFYKKPWKYLLRCTDENKAEQMARACEYLCNSNLVGYDQSQRLTLHNELKAIAYDYKSLTTPCECDCSSLMTVCAECAGIYPPYTNGNAPVTANMVKLFQRTGWFTVIKDGINDERNLRRGDILVGAPNTHTVMVLDDGVGSQPTISLDEIAKQVLDGKWGNGAERKKRLTDAGYDYKEIQAKVNKLVK